MPVQASFKPQNPQTATKKIPLWAGSLIIAVISAVVIWLFLLPVKTPQGAYGLEMSKGQETSVAEIGLKVRLADIKTIINSASGSESSTSTNIFIVNIEGLEGKCPPGVVSFAVGGFSSGSETNTYACDGKTYTAVPQKYNGITKKLNFYIKPN